jgi:ankyrin repeat protein
MEKLFTNVEFFFNIFNEDILNILKDIENGNISKELYESINTQDIYGNTLLHYALGYEKIKSVLFLIKLNVKTDILNNNRLSVLHILFIKCVGFMKKYDFKAIAYLEISKHLIKKGADPYIKNINIPSPFYIIKKFINCQDPNGDTILHYLIKKDKISTAIYIIEDIGANINLQNNNGETPLHFAVTNALDNYENFEMFNFILFLLKNRANENIKNKNGKFPGDIFFNFLIKKDIKKN